MNPATKKLELLVHVLHHLTAIFKEKAVLKGGMELALFASERFTNDLDFVFVPFKSKKDIVADIQACLELLGRNYKIESSLNSKNAKFYVSNAIAEIIVEVSVSNSVESIPVNTEVLAQKHKLPAQMIRVMKPEIALAHKLAAWNERRLVRDLYDIYFWFGILSVSPDLTTLKDRLQSVDSKLPAIKKRKTMTLADFCDDLKLEIEQLNQSRLDAELPSISPHSRLGLDINIKAQITRLIYELSSSEE